MRAGLLDKRVTLQQQTTTRNSLGEAVVGWTDVATVWASIEPLQGREMWAQMQVQSEITARIRIRYRPGVVASMRVVYGTRIFTISSVIDANERHAELQLMCSEGVANG
jgi:SPP1 family predicted phage head-tail adaptor